MTLRDIIEKLCDWVNFRVVVSKHGNVFVTYDNYDDADQDHINNCLNCEVEIIDTTEDGVLILVVDGDTGTEDE